MEVTVVTDRTIAEMHYEIFSKHELKVSVLPCLICFALFWKPAFFLRSSCKSLLSFWQANVSSSILYSTYKDIANWGLIKNAKLLSDYYKKLAWSNNTKETVEAKATVVDTYTALCILVQHIQLLNQNQYESQRWSLWH